MSECIFCKIVKGEIPANKVYEDDGTLAFLDIHPVNPGHVLVIPKTHFQDFLSTTPDVAAELMAVILQITSGILEAVGAEGFNLGVNNGASAGQIIFHTHFHIMPRFSYDKHKLWHGEEMTGEKLKEIGEKIRGANF